MDPRFVGRSEQLGRIRAQLAEPDPGPLMIVGEPGMGRSTLLRAALATVDPGRHTVLHLRAGDGRPYSSLQHLLPADRAHRVERAGFNGVDDVARTIAASAAGRRLMLAADDADRVDQLSMLVLRRLNRQSGSVVLVTHADPLPSVGGDAVDCLRYERGIATVRLPPLNGDEVGVLLARLMDGPVRSATVAALHAATRGNPGLLNDIVVRQNLRARMVRDNGRWRLDDSPRGTGATLTCRGATSLLAAVRAAWAALELGKVDDLCRLAAWSGLADQVALTRAMVLLLRGRPDHGLAVLDTVPHEAEQAGRNVCSAALVRAMCLGFGGDQLDRATRLLADLAARHPTRRDTLLAYRVWLLAIAGRCDDAAATDPSSAANRRAGLFLHAARAVADLGNTRSISAVHHARRALVLAEADRAELPWMQPYLTALLIDALLLAGRITEATSMATEFHAGAPNRDWSVAVALAGLTMRAAPARIPASYGP